MTDHDSVEAPASANDELRPAPSLPDGEYAIVEQLGHRVMVGRVCEVERFGAKLMQIEPVYADALLPPILIGGGTLYAFTPCTAAQALLRQPRYWYQLPAPLMELNRDEEQRTAALPAPEEEAVFAPAFLSETFGDG